MASGQVGTDHVTELENQLVEARSEINLLNSKLAKMTTCEVGLVW